jgi:hypothetical protein
MLEIIDETEERGCGLGAPSGADGKGPYSQSTEKRSSRKLIG